jgi:hypothetical protein
LSLYLRGETLNPACSPGSPNCTVQSSPLTIGNLVLSHTGLTDSRTFTFPDVSDTLVSLTATQTLTNKTLGPGSVWNGNVIGASYGGTGLSSIDTANQILGVNAGGTGLEYKNITSLFTAGTGISITGTTNATIANTGILSLTAGSGISISSGQNPTITNIGVLSLNSATGTLTLQGTTNQVNVSTAGSTITLSTPQDIHTGATPTFNSLTLSSLTPGSVLFAGNGGTISQNNQKFFWDNTNLILGIGTSTPAGILHIATGTVNALVVDNTGNVGIGTTSPSSRLHVAVPSGTTQLAAQIQNLQNAAGAHGLLINTTNTSTSTYALDVQSGGISRLYVRSDGNVGIGTTTPAYRLELPDIANASGQGRANAWITYSDIRFKENITPITNALEKINNLQGVYFDWKQNGKRDIGFIAQEVEPVLSEVVFTDPSGIKSLDYSRLTALLVQGIKDLILGFTEKVKASLNELGIIIENSVAKIKEIFTEKITTKQFCLKGDDGETIFLDKNQVKELLNRSGGSYTSVIDNNQNTSNNNSTTTTNNNEVNTNTTTNTNETNTNNGTESNSSSTTNTSTNEGNTTSTDESTNNDSQESVSNQNQSASENTTSTTTSSQTSNVNDNQSSSTESTTSSN